MANVIENPDEIQDWERREESGDGNLSAEELQLVAEARIAVRRVVNGCPELPGHTRRALMSTFRLLDRWVPDQGSHLRSVR